MLDYSSDLPIQDVLECSLKNGSILQVKKLFPVNLAGSTKRNYLAL